MRILIIGYGSIGKRHYEVLKNFKNVVTIDIVTQQILKNKTTYFNLNNIDNINIYDYFIIASATNKHFEHLSYLELNVKNKLIFCEKPIFDTYKNLIIKNNKVYIGYVLRFHPLFQKLSKLVETEKIINVNVNCGQYLPTWRADTNYKDSYSAKKEEGGGVLLDLSHEIDYVQYLCGNINELHSYQVKISDLEINSDDFVNIIGKTNKNIFINIAIDYISKITHRRLFLNTLNYSYELDFIQNILIQKDKNGTELIFKNTDLERNMLFKSMHESILSNRTKYICTYTEAIEVMKTVSIVQEQNK